MFRERLNRLVAAHQALWGDAERKSATLAKRHRFSRSYLRDLTPEQRETYTFYRRVKKIPRAEALALIHGPTHIPV